MRDMVRASLIKSRSAVFVVLFICFLLYQNFTYGTLGVIHGTFVTFDYAGRLDDFKKLLSELESIHSDTIIIQSVGETVCGGSPVCNPVEKLDLNSLHKMLDAAAEKGIYVYVGLYNTFDNQEFWNEPVLSKIIGASLSYVDKINASSIPNHAAFAGFYLSPESYAGVHSIELISLYYKKMVTEIKRKSDKPIIAGAFLDPLAGSQKNPSSPLTPDQLKNWITKFMYDPQVGCFADIFLLQDGVGAFDNPVITSTGYNLSSYLSAAKLAIKNNSSRSQFWVVAELFQWSRDKSGAYDKTNWYAPSSMKLINEQLYVDRLHADRVISWVNQHEMTANAFEPLYPERKKQAAHLLKAYKAIYFNQGKWYGNSIKYIYLGAQPKSPYMDSSYRKLLDNNVGQERWFQWEISEWVGFDNSSGLSQTRTILVDLGAYNQPVSDLSVVFMTHVEYGIKYPENMTVLVSNDGVTYKELGKMANKKYSDDFDSTSPTVDRKTKYSRAVYFVSSEQALRGRYVKINIQQKPWSWLFLSEIELFSFTK